MAYSFRILFLCVYHFNEYFCRKSINLRSLAKRENKKSGRKWQEHKRLNVLCLCAMVVSIAVVVVDFTLFVAFFAAFFLQNNVWCSNSIFVSFQCLMTTCGEVNTLTNFYSLLSFSQHSKTVCQFIQTYIFLDIKYEIFHFFMKFRAQNRCSLQKHASIPKHTSINWNT